MRLSTGRGRPCETGMVLLSVLVIFLIVTGSSMSFIWVMNQQQTRAGARYRAIAALAVAESGVHRALSVLESVTPDAASPGRTWRPDAYAETMQVGALEGRFTVSVSDGPGGSVLIASTGQVAGVTRKVLARAHLASPALLAALFGASYVRLEEPPAAAILLPFAGPNPDQVRSRDRPWVHIAAGQGIWFATTDVSINDPSLKLDAGVRSFDASNHLASVPDQPPPGPVRLLLARGAEITIGQALQRVDLQQLRTQGVYLDGVVLRSGDIPASPTVDRAYYRSAASANSANAHVNAAAGRYLGNPFLMLKPDSLYSQDEFKQLLAFLETQATPARLQGVVYVRGPVALSWSPQLQISDGALVVEGALDVGQGARLDVTHSAATRTLPGVIVLDGGLTITQRAGLTAHGLVYADETIEVSEGAHVYVIGSVVGRDPGLSFHNFGATILIRYDPAVLGTPGLLAPAGSTVIAWVSSWEDFP